MKKILLGFMLAFFLLSEYSFAGDLTRDEVYNACLVVETKHAAADGQTEPKLAAHYFCTIVADDCAERPNGQQCSKAKQQYGL